MARQIAQDSQLKITRHGAPSFANSSSSVSQKIAVLLPGWVGDAVMATPALRALATRTNAKDSLLGVMLPPVADVLDGLPWFDDKLIYQKRKLSSRLSLASKLRAHRPDTVVLLTNSWWTALVARLSGAKTRIGYARDGRSWMLTHSIAAQRQPGGKFAPVPAIDYYLALVEQLGCDISNRRMEITVDPRDRQRAQELFAAIGFDQQRRTIVINSSGLWGTAKVWPADKVEQLARRIVENHPWQVLLHCGPAERAATDAIAWRINHPRVASMGRASELPLGLTKAVMARASVVVSTDSGPRHIAVALDRPVVGLYGPTDPAWTRTYNVPEVEVGLQLACRGCWQKACPLQHNRCMRDLGVETVYGAVVASATTTGRSLAA